MVKKFRAHPLMIFTFLKPFLFVLVLPLINGIVQHFKDKTVDNVLGAEIVLFAIILSIAILRWLSFSLVCDTKENSVTVRQGLLFKKRAKIAISKISSVQTAKNPIDAVFFAVTYRINTEAGTISRADFEFKLSNRNSAQVSGLLYGKCDTNAVKFSAIRVAILAATTSSAFTGIILGVPIINMAGRLLGVAITDMLEEFNRAAIKVETYFPPIVNSICAILLVSYLVAFIYSFLKYVNFKLFFEQDKLEVRSGFFVRLRTSFKKKAINNIKIEQTPLMIILRRFAMKVSVGGYGDNKSESEVIIPLGESKEMRKRFSEYFPFFLPGQEGIRPKQSLLMKSRFLSWPLYYFLGVVAVATILSFRFKDFTRFILFLMVVASLIIFCYAYLCLFEYNNGTAKFGDNIYLCSNKGFRTCEFYCPKENVGEIKIIRLMPVDFFYKSCRVRVLIRSERADNLRVRHLDYETVKSEVYKTFNIKK